MKISKFKIFLTLFTFALLLFIPAHADAGQLLFTIAGSAVGGFFGGPIGAYLGGLAGSLLGGLIFSENVTVHGPRLTDKSVQSAAFGTHITKHWGSDRLAAQIIFSSGLKETKHKQKVGGKAFGPSQTSVTYTYAVDIMLAFSRRAVGVKRIWADTKLIYDSSGATLEKAMARAGSALEARPGDEDQLPSALEESYHGAGTVSAHRGLFCLEAENFQLADFGNRIPNFTAEVFTEGEIPFGRIGGFTPPDPESSYWNSSLGHVDQYGGIYALYFPFADRFWAGNGNRLFYWTASHPDAPARESKVPITWSQTASTASNVRLRSDEHSYMVHGSATTLGHATAYYSIPSQAETLFDMHGHDAAELAVKYGTEMFIVSGNTALFFGADPVHLIKFAMGDPDTVVAESRVLWDESGGGLCMDMGRSDNFLWALVSRGAAGSRLLKLNPTTLALVSSVSLSSVSNPLALSAESDARIHIMAATNTGVRFYEVQNEQPPVLKHTATGDIYSGSRGFSTFGLRTFGDLYIVDFAGYIGGFPALIDVFGAQPATDDVALWRIVRDLNIMAGLDSVVDSAPPAVGDIAVGELTDRVHGYSITRSMTARAALLQLQQSYFFDAREKDLQIDYPKRGKATVRSLPGADLAARSSLAEQLPDRLTIARTRESELPLRVHLIYNSWEANYQPGHEYAPRLITAARATITVELSIALTSTQARQIADALLALAWLERESFSLRASRKYLPIDAADNIEVVITENGD